MSKSFTPLTIELNIAPSLMKHRDEFIAALQSVIREQVNNPIAGFEVCQFSKTSCNYGNAVVYPIYDEDIAPDFVSRLRYSAKACHDMGNKPYRILVNGYVSLLAEAMAFPERSVSSQVSSIMASFKRFHAPDIVVTVVPPFSDEDGHQTLDCAVLSFDSGYTIAKKASMVLYGTYLKRYNDCLGKAHYKFADTGIVEGTASMFDDAAEDIEFFKSVVKQAYLEYVKETTAPSVRG